MDLAWIDGDGSKPWYLVNPKIAGKWMFIPLKMVLIGIDPYPDRIDHGSFPFSLGLPDELPGSAVCGRCSNASGLTGRAAGAETSDLDGWRLGNGDWISKNCWIDIPIDDLYKNHPRILGKWWFQQQISGVTQQTYPIWPRNGIAPHVGEKMRRWIW